MPTQPKDFVHLGIALSVYPDGTLGGITTSKIGASFFEIPPTLAKEIAYAILATGTSAAVIDPPKYDTPRLITTPKNVRKEGTLWAADIVILGSVVTYYYINRDKARAINPLHQIGEYGRVRYVGLL